MMRTWLGTGKIPILNQQCEKYLHRPPTGYGKIKVAGQLPTHLLPVVLPRSFRATPDGDLFGLFPQPNFG